MLKKRLLKILSHPFDLWYKCHDFFSVLYLGKWGHAVLLCGKIKKKPRNLDNLFLENIISWKDNIFLHLINIIQDQLSEVNKM